MFETLLGQIGCTTNRNLTQIIFGLGKYLFPINARSKNNHAMCNRMRKSHTFKIRCYGANMVELNEYLDIFTCSDTEQKHF